MERGVLRFEKDESRYIRLADERMQKDDLPGALGFLFNALALNRSAQTLMDIADVYAQMELYELSNKYWFYYMEKAPKDKVSIAYEELAINFFYMDDYLSSSFYFHQKLSADGFLSKDGVDKEIIEFFSGEEFKNNAYYIAYPFDKADYSYTVKRAKRALSGGNYLEAIKLYEKIPIECHDEESLGDLSICYLMNDDADKSASVARESIAFLGENVTAYCNLSNVYDFKEDYEKSEYYYQQALSLVNGDKNEELKLATCAIERSDHKTVKECLKKILDERKYDTTMQFFYGLSLLNTGDFEGGRACLSAVYRLDVTDKVFKFYAEYANKLCCGGGREYLPIKYVKSFPESVVKDYENKLSKLISVANKSGVSLKKEQYKEVVEWGLYASEDLARKSVYILAYEYSSYAKKLLKGYLMDNEGDTQIKQLIVYALTVNGLKERLNIVNRNFFFKLKPKKLSFENEKKGALYFGAYAVALSRMAFLGVEKLDKLASVIELIYSRLERSLRKDDVTSEEIAALAVLLCGYPRFQTKKEVMRIFEVKKDKLSLLREIFNGEKND